MTTKEFKFTDEEFDEALERAKARGLLTEGPLDPDGERTLIPNKKLIKKEIENYRKLRKQLTQKLEELTIETIREHEPEGIESKQLWYKVRAKWFELNLPLIPEIENYGDDDDNDNE